MKIVRRLPDRAYLDRWLWVPKRFIDVNSVKSALTYEVASSYGANGRTRFLYLWKETVHHLLVPRAFWDVSRLPCDVVDCRPQKYEEVDFKSRIKLDHRMKEVDGHKLLMPTGDDVQQRSMAALEAAQGGVLQLACGKGKAQPVNTPVLTPDGWRPIGDLRPGDEVIGSNGKPTPVIGVFPQGRLPVFSVVMEDGTSTRCCAQHLWFTQTPSERRAGKQGSVKTLADVKRTLRTSAGAQHSIQRVQPVHYREQTPVYEPWLMGFYLGDGSSGIYKSSRRITLDKGNVNTLKKAMRFIARGGDCASLLPATSRNANRTVVVRFKKGLSSPFWNALDESRLIGVDSLNKFIPSRYKYASVEERWELLSGLLDADGSVTRTGRTLSTSSRLLAEDVVELARSLGCRVHVEERQTYYTYKGTRRAGAPSFRLHITHPKLGKSRYQRQYIQEVVEAGEEDCVCIRVAAEDSLYVTENFIVTHNTVVALEHITRGRVPSLVMVDNTNLLYQWLREAEALLSVPGGIGVFGDGKKEWDKNLVIATYHSIANWSETIPEEARRRFGRIYWDEGHHCPAPVFSKTADMFYGSRFSLTATPERDDGLHVLSDGHIGPIVYKDLTPTMKPSFAFLWSGLELNLRDPTTATKVLDTNGEVHISKLNSYFGQWAARVNILLQMIWQAHQNGRMVLVLSNSVDEVVNLANCWERPGHPLYTDIPIPTPADVGEQLNPITLSPKDEAVLKRKKEHLVKQLSKIAKQLGMLGSNGEPDLDAVVKAGLSANPPAVKDVAILSAEFTRVLQTEKQAGIARKIQNELEKRQRQYILELVEQSKSCGMLTYEVAPKTRQKFLAERNVIFAITKYGKEGMDCPRLDTVILSSLFSNRNGLQQLMGRPTRPHPNKKSPVLLAMVDDIGQCIGMARKLMNHLRSWPSEEGGPYEPILIGFPSSWRSKTTITTADVFGR